MHDTGTTLRSLYGPDAVDAPLRVQPPVHSFWNSRRMHAVFTVSGLVVACYWVFGMMFPPLFGFIDLLVPDGWLRGQRTWTVMGWITGAWFAIALTTYAMIDARRATPTRVTLWQWANDRGFRPIAAPDPRLLGRHTYLLDGHSHRWAGVVRGHVDGLDAVAGAVTWKVEEEMDRSMLFVRVRMSDEAGAIHRWRCSLRRFVLLTDDDVEAGLEHELRLESVMLDSTCRVRVDAAPDHPLWRQVFSPELVHAMAHRFEVSWRLEGPDLLLVADDEDVGSMPAERLDTMCAAGAFIAGHLHELGTTIERARQSTRRGDLPAA